MRLQTNLGNRIQNMHADYENFQMDRHTRIEHLFGSKLKSLNEIQKEKLNRT